MKINSMANNSPYSPRWARIVSDLFVPPAFSLLSFIFLAFYFEHSFVSKLSVALSGILFGFVLPVILFLFLRRKKKIADNDATIKEERTVPYLWGIAFEITAALWLYFAGVSVISVALWLAYAGNTLILVLINKFWKISAHAIGSSTALGLLVFVFGLQGFLILPLIILIGISRVRLGVHTKLQVLAGALLGFVSTFLQLFVFVKIL